MVPIPKDRLAPIPDRERVKRLIAGWNDFLAAMQKVYQIKKSTRLYHPSPPGMRDHLRKLAQGGLRQLSLDHDYHFTETIHRYLLIKTESCYVFRMLAQILIWLSGREKWRQFGKQNTAFSLFG